MIPVTHVWQTDFGLRTIPRQIAEATVFRKDGMPDARYSVGNRLFRMWLAEIDEPIPYRLTDAGRKHLEGK